MESASTTSSNKTTPDNVFHSVSIRARPNRRPETAVSESCDQKQLFISSPSSAAMCTGPVSYCRYLITYQQTLKQITIMLTESKLFIFALRKSSCGFCGRKKRAGWGQRKGKGCVVSLLTDAYQTGEASRDQHIKIKKKCYFLLRSVISSQMRARGSRELLFFFFYKTRE